jgi:hypothetical protein
MVVQKEFFDNVGIHDRLRYRIRTDHGQVVDFVVQYETEIAGTFVAVVRYDASHGHGHRDLLSIDGSTIRKDWLPAHLDLKECLDYAADDLRSNWRRYREQFLERLR